MNGSDSSNTKRSATRQLTISSYFSKSACSNSTGSADTDAGRRLEPISVVSVPKFRTIDEIYDSDKASSSSDKSKKRKAMQQRQGPSKKLKLTSTSDQYALDFGQKLQVECPECGMPYYLGVAEEEEAHKQFHKQKLNPAPILFPKWKGMQIVMEYPDDSFIVSVATNSEDSKRKKVMELREFVDKELSFAVVTTRTPVDEKAFIYVHKKKAVGLIVAERIQFANRVVVDTSSPNEDENSVVCSKEKEPASLGISRIWVHKDYRRKNIATKLLDVVRANFIYGSPIPKHLCALSQPTPDGKRFGTAYFGTPSKVETVLQLAMKRPAQVVLGYLKLESEMH